MFSFLNLFFFFKRFVEAETYFFQFRHFLMLKKILTRLLRSRSGKKGGGIG